jgi:hypothetical protein
MRKLVIATIAAGLVLAAGAALLRFGHRLATLTLVSEQRQREALGAWTRRRLMAGRLDVLDAAADSLQRCDVRFGDGAPKLRSFYFFGFRSVGDPATPARWAEHLEAIRGWRDARPDSKAADVALAFALIGRGWAARGGGYAVTVSGKGWRGFEGDLAEAGSILRQCRERCASSPAWYDAMLQVMHGLGADEADYLDVYREGVARFPGYLSFYLDRAWHLQPRWYGRAGDWERFADTCATALPDSVRDEIYARIVLFQSRYELNIIRASRGLEWERLARGLEVWRRRYPQSTHPLSATAMFAYQSGRRADARRAFAALRDTVDLDVWISEVIYLRARSWAGEG